MKSNNANVEWSDDDDDSSSSFDDFSNVEGGAMTTTTTGMTTPRPVRQGERRPYHRGRVSATAKRVHACTPMEIIAGGIAIISIATSAVAMIVVPSNIVVYAAGALSW